MNGPEVERTPRRVPPWVGEALLALVVVLGALAVRLVYLEHIENDNDAIQKWWTVKRYLTGTPIRLWDHHSARLAINVPAYLVQVVFGTHARNYYVLPVFMGVAMALLAYLTARRLSGPVTGVLAAILVTAFPQMERTASQFLPGVFSGAYVMLAVYALVVYAGRPRRGWLLFAGTALFAAYLSRMTTLYFLPGFVFAVWLRRRSLLDVFWLLLPLAVLFAIETAAYAIFTDYEFGRYSIINTTHFRHDPSQAKPMTLAGITRRFTEAHWYWHIALYALPVAAATLLVFARKRGSTAVVIVAFSFLLFLAVPVRGSNMAQTVRTHQRYFSPVIGPMMVVFAVWASTVVGSWRARWRGVLSGGLRSIVERRAGWCALGLFVGYVAVSVHEGWDDLDSQHPLLRTGQLTRQFSRAYEIGVPIVAASSHAKALKEVRWMYLRRDTIEDAKGRLRPPKVRFVKHKGKRYAYLGKGISPGDVKRALKTRKCIITVKRVMGKHRNRTLRVVKSRMSRRCGR